MTVRHRRSAATAYCGVMLACAAPALAQTSPGDLAVEPSAAASGTQVFVPSDFSAFAPRSALDMIEQIPGFQISGAGGGGGGGGNDARGLGQASGNLLLNGERLSSKSVSAEDQLGRIPVENVLRIEVVDGASFGIPGLSGRVANIIAEVGGLSGQFEWRPQWSTGPSKLGVTEGDFSLSAATGPVEYTLALAVGTFRRGSAGPAVFVDADGVIDERFNFSQAEFDRPELSGNFRIQVAPEVVANLNLLGGLMRFREREDENRVFGNPLPPFLERFRTSNDRWSYEIGADIDFPLGPGRLRLIALDSFEDGDRVSNSRRNEGDLPTSGTQFGQDSQTGERIARGEYSWPLFGADWQLSAEAAFNRLDQVGRLFAYEPVDDVFVQIPFPSGVGGVREERFESLLSAGFPLASNLTVQIIAGPEYSKISQTGANALARTFLRPKGSVTLGWAPRAGIDVSLRLERRVGQLDFGDFLASVNLTDENASAGNNELRPEQSWNTTLEVAKDFGAWGSATLRLFDERIEDLILFVPVDGGEARGNLESAHRYGMRLRGTLQTAPVGLAGGRFDLTLTAEESQLLDPVTLIDRRFDRNDPFEFRLDFRHDIPATDYAWGTEFRHTTRAPTLRLEQEILDFPPNTFGAVFVEHKDVFGTVVRIRVGNVFDENSTLIRTIYDGPRNTAPILFTENRQRRIGQTVNLTVSGNF